MPFLSAFWVSAPSIAGGIVEKALTCPSPCFDSFEWHCSFFPNSLHPAAPPSLGLFVNADRTERLQVSHPPPLPPPTPQNLASVAASLNAGKLLLVDNGCVGLRSPV